jgi:hypothetical protein
MIVDIGDVAVQLRSSDDERTEVLVRHLGAAPEHPGPAAASVRYEVEGPPTPEAPPRLTVEDIRLWQDGSTLRVLHASGASAVVSGDEAWIGGGGADIDGPFHRMLLVVVAQLLAHRDRFVLHAAALVPRRDAVLVLGDTGQGKSTTALAGLHAGWPVLGDDMVVLRPGADGPEVAGVARPGALPSDVGGDIDGPLIVGDPRGRRIIAPSVFTRGWFPAGVVVRTAHGDAPEGARCALDPRAALYALMSAFPSALTPAFMRRYLPIAAALSRGPTFDLLLGSDPTRRLADAARLLDAPAG